MFLRFLRAMAMQISVEERRKKKNEVTEREPPEIPTLHQIKQVSSFKRTRAPTRDKAKKGKYLNLSVIFLFVFVFIFFFFCFANLISQKIICTHKQKIAFSLVNFRTALEMAKKYAQFFRINFPLT